MCYTLAMGRTAIVRARVSPTLKLAAENVLAELGLSTSDAITLFLTQLAARRKLPLTLSADGESRNAQPVSGATLLASGLAGAWEHHGNLGESVALARALRESAERARRHGAP